jgi:hypothetical protein
MASTVGTVTAARIGSDIGPGGFPRTSKSVAPHADVSPEHIQQLEAEIIALKHRYGQEQAAAANLGRTQHRRNSASMSGDSGEHFHRKNKCSCARVKRAIVKCV